MLFNWFNRLGVQRKMIISNLLIIVIPFIVLFIALSLVWGVYSIYKSSRAPSMDDACS